jgi:hypothetical protein
VRENEKTTEVEEKKITTREGAFAPLKRPQFMCSRVSTLRNMNQIHALITPSNRHPYTSTIWINTKQR